MRTAHFVTLLTEFVDCRDGSVPTLRLSESAISTVCQAMSNPYHRQIFLGVGENNLLRLVLGYLGLWTSDNVLLSVPVTMRIYEHITMPRLGSVLYS
jgi:hypothetical protein